MSLCISACSLGVLTQRATTTGALGLGSHGLRPQKPPPRSSNASLDCCCSFKGGSSDFAGWQHGQSGGHGRTFVFSRVVRVLQQPLRRQRAMYSGGKQAESLAASASASASAAWA
ncbi:hypothetical protein FA09DRAFT_167168 [Tilletiopsis washingtonensis]|uniref:Uncharacterized protein n=1 Tax=Tilletiopsis washingtonensis TaxID=58919 RepID=A0A316Z120_9BASI|nr:hypothetical protein FA09DRAFT_167168 [Tilletiopsis washingtonensis]PWN94754.1 hypothetical protein FA09DRAFT_167168 [Tilletiopsis washingtonensis]